MKRILVILLTSLLLILTACGGNDSTENTSANNEKDNQNTTEENNNNNKEESDGEIPVYQIGETAIIYSEDFDLDYEVTVNSFEIAKEVNGVGIEELVTNVEEDDEGGFLAIEVTYTNISDEAYTPNERFLSYFGYGGGGESLTDYDDMFFPELEEELAPGEEITGKLVYLSAAAIEDYFTLTYEPMQDGETWFHLPNPNLN
ncbi:MAG TPA: DUF4352 domain-containing protein [Cerasibacillus sp.]|uniref:DUF4352 domain-containing protein n=1 Tax=Cerasibacillus sp. TaxID=2498711 RepID=UPI002F41C5C7